HRCCGRLWDSQTVLSVCLPGGRRRGSCCHAPSPQTRPDITCCKPSDQCVSCGARFPWAGSESRACGMTRHAAPTWSNAGAQQLDWPGRSGCRLMGVVVLRTAYRCIVVAMVTALLALAGMPSRPAAADVRLPMGGGAGIVINGDTMCT